MLLLVTAAIQAVISGFLYRFFFFFLRCFKGLTEIQTHLEARRSRLSLLSSLTSRPLS